jgi:hypothetical protein
MLPYSFDFITHPAIPLLFLISIIITAQLTALPFFKRSIVLTVYSRSSGVLSPHRRTQLQYLLTSRSFPSGFIIHLSKHMQLRSINFFCLHRHLQRISEQAILFILSSHCTECHPDQFLTGIPTPLHFLLSLSFSSFCSEVTLHNFYRTPCPHLYK